MRRTTSLPGALVAWSLFMAVFAGEAVAQDWRTASREPAGLAPDPAVTPEAVVQVYAARAVRWRGNFGVHTWIAVKPTGADRFTVHELMGYQTRRTGNGVRSSQRAADMMWFGNRPQALADVRGPGVDELIERINKAVADYSFAGSYRLWPGPNSNTFTAEILREVPELRVELPAHAIGKDYLGAPFVARTPGGTGLQVNTYGLAGVLAGWHEGIEVSIAGLTFGLNPSRLSLKLPMLGNVGLLSASQPKELATSSRARLIRRADR